MVDGHLVHFNTKKKVYPNGLIKTTVCSNPIFVLEGYENSEWKQPKSTNAEHDETMGCTITDEMLTAFKKYVPEKEKPEKLKTFGAVRDDNVRRAKEKVFDISMMNKFDYFVTWTLDKEKINRYDPDIVSKKIQQTLKDLVRRNDCKYLGVAEYHQDGAIHMHLLMSGEFILIDSGKKTKKTYNGCRKTVYNMENWKFGHSTAVKLDDNVERVSNYIVKYISKDFRKIFGNFYYAGGDIIRKPKIEICDTDYREFEAKEYHVEAVRMSFKYQIDRSACPCGEI